MNRILSVSIFLSILAVESNAFAQVQATVPAQPEAIAAPTPPLQWVNTSVAQINNNAPMTAVTPAFTPVPNPNQQSQMQQQQQVPDVQLPYPLDTPSSQ